MIIISLLVFFHWQFCNDDCCSNSDFPIYNDCPIYILALLIIVCPVYKDSPVFQAVKSIDEIDHHHDLYSSIGSSVTMIVLLINTALFMLAFL